MEDYFAHESAVIDSGSRIGRDCRIWHFVHVSSGAVLGVDVSLGQGVYVAGRAVIGDRCKIQNNVSVYDDVTLEADVFCGPSVVFTNVYNPRAKINRKAEYLPTLVRVGATLGANSTIVCGVEVGKFAFVGAGAVVTEDVKNYALVVGVPARQIGWMSEYGERLSLPLDGYGEAVCVKSHERYRLQNGKVVKV